MARTRKKNESSNEGSVLRIAVVGACASGKSTLITSLKNEGYEVRHVAQEHSYVPDMWRRITNPDILIYLDVDYEHIKVRRPRTNLKPADLIEQNRRLSHAKANCDLYIDTSEIDPDVVFKRSLTYLKDQSE